MELFINNWFMMIAMVSVLIFMGSLVYKFFKLPNSKQMDKVKEWLIYACLQAELKLGSGTGVIKLRLVYDSFLSKFPWLAKVVSFELFSSMVDEALVTVREMLESNRAVRELVAKEVKDDA